MTVKNNVKKAALTAAATALVGIGTSAYGNNTSADTMPPDNTSQTVDSNVRVVRGTLGHERMTDVYIPNSANRYKAYYLDTDGDLLEDTICFEIISDNGLRTDYKPGSHMIITETRGPDGRWIISKIEVDSRRRILAADMSR